MKDERFIYMSRSVIINRVVQYLMKDYKISADDAYNKFMKTQTFMLLQDNKTHLVEKSPEAIYNMLKLELQGNIEKWIEYGM